MSAPIGDTASITLLTGLPGSGKTLRTVWWILDAIRRGEMVFVCNINGINVPGVIPWDDPTRWRELPPGSVLVVDEAQQFFRARRGGEPPEYLTAMETIRHHGVRLVLTTQQPSYLDTHLRGLVGLHEHLVRQNGKAAAKIYRSSQVIEEVRSTRTLAACDHETWSYPADVFAHYKSAEVHTVRYRMSAVHRRVLAIMIPAALLFVGVWVYLFADAQGISDTGTQTPASPASVPVSNAHGDGGGRDAPRINSAVDYAEYYTPLIAEMPWTAPAFINRAPASNPKLFCMSSATSCRCITEQATRYQLPDHKCRDIARWGQPYNPHLRPETDRPKREGARDRSGAGV